MIQLINVLFFNLGELFLIFSLNFSLVYLFISLALTYFIYSLITKQNKINYINYISLIKDK
jgi:hypothetical protein